MAQRVHTFKEEEIKPMLDLFALGKSPSEIVEAMGKPVKVVEAKLLRMGYLDTACSGCKAHLKRIEARLDALENKPKRAYVRKAAR